MLDGSGLTAGDLVVPDRRPASRRTAAPRTISDQGLVQQVLDITVPANVVAPLVVVTTSGGSFTFRGGAAATPLADLAPADAGDTLANALSVNLPADRRVTIAQTIGDNAFAGQDVDLYQLTANAGDLLTLDAARQSGNFLYVRLFDAAGNPLANDGFSGPDSSPRIALFQVAGDRHVLRGRQRLVEHDV